MLKVQPSVGGGASGAVTPGQEDPRQARRRHLQSVLAESERAIAALERLDLALVSDLRTGAAARSDDLDALADELEQLASRARRFAFYLVPAVLLVVTFLPLPLFSRLVSTLDLRQTSNFDRIRMAEAGVEMIRDFPLLGVGPDNVKSKYALYRAHDAPRARPPHLHNNVIQLWAERGILGLATYLAFLVLFLRQCVRAWGGPARMWAQAGIAVTVALAVAGLFEFNFGDTEVFYLMMNVTAYIVVSIEQSRPGPNTAPASLVPGTT